MWRAAWLFALAELERKQLKYEDSIGHHKEALQLFSRHLHPDNLNIASSHNMLGTLYLEIGDFSLALENLQKALDIFTKRRHPSIKLTLMNLGALYHRMGEHKIALEYYEKALAVPVTQGDNNTLDSTILTSQAEIYKSISNFEVAEELYLKALDHNIKFLGPIHPAVALSYNNLALAASTLGNFTQALILCLKALNIQQRIF